MHLCTLTCVCDVIGYVYFKVEELERSCVEKDQHNRSLSEELKSTKAALHSKEGTCTHLSVYLFTCDQLTNVYFFTLHTFFQL